MSPINFKFANKVLKPPKQQYSDNIESVADLHIWSDGEQCVSCWKMSITERLYALIFGKVWIGVLSGGTQPPIYAVSTKEYLKEVKN